MKITKTLGCLLISLLVITCQPAKNESMLNTMQADEIVSISLNNGVYSFKFLKDFEHQVAFAESISEIETKTIDRKTRLDSFSEASQ